MNKAAIIAAPLGVVLLFPMLMLMAVAGVGGITQASTACTTTSTSSSGGAAIGIGTLNWRGASHYKKDPHPGEQPYTKRVPNMIAKINASGTSIVGFQEFEAPQASDFLSRAGSTWGLIASKKGHHTGYDDAIAYRKSDWTVTAVTYVRIPYFNTEVDSIPLAKLHSTAGLGDVFVLNTHNPANVGGSQAKNRATAIKNEAEALAAVGKANPGVPILMTGDMNDAAAFLTPMLTSLKANGQHGWSAANPIKSSGGSPGWGGHIDWILGNAEVTFTGTVTDKSTNDNAHSYTDHPFVHTTAQISGAAGSTGDTPPAINASTGGTVKGAVRLVQANLPSKQPYGPRLAAGMARITAVKPDFITLNEEFARSVPQLEKAAPGYSAYRDSSNPADDPSHQSRDEVVMWKSAAWTKVSAGRVTLIDHKPENPGHTRSRYATWVILQATSDPTTEIVVVSVHMPINPAGLGGHGKAKGDRGINYGAGMDNLISLINQLGQYAPVLVGGDFNDHPNQSQSWAAVPKMTAAGYRYTVAPTNGIDFVWYPKGATATSSSIDPGDTSDHPAFNDTVVNMNGAGPSTSAGTTTVPQAATGGCSPCPSSGTVGSAITLTAATAGGPLHNAEVAAEAAYQAGFRGNDLYTMVWIAGGESGYNPKAINHYSEGGRTYYVYGLWQISSIHAGISVPGIYDPLTNAKQAFALYRGRGGSATGDGGPASRFDDWSAHVPANESRYGATARKAIAAVTSGSGSTVSVASTATCTAASTSVKGSGNFTPNTSVPYVGPYTPSQLVARMQKIMALNGTGRNLDPFFGTEPDGSWHDDCQHFVAVLDGRSSSGYDSAAAAWQHFLATGAAHPAGSSDGMSPPAGAWLYYGDNHVVVYLGNNVVAGTDTWGDGTAKIGPASDVQKWLASQGGYKGWVVPWGAPANTTANSATAA